MACAAVVSLDTPGGERTSVGEVELEGQRGGGVGDAEGFRLTAEQAARCQRGFSDAYPQTPPPTTLQSNLHPTRPPTDTFHLHDEE